jgi:rhamnosyltransferase
VGFRASVIVRTKDKERSLEAALRSLRRQTVEPEIILVDSGSRDRTLEIGRRYSNKLLEIPEEDFSYGRALNVGAAAASAPVHFALSAHCQLRAADWIERSLELYRRSDVAGTCGMATPVPGRPAEGVFYQNADHIHRHPLWGFSNHASSWRAEVWREFPFDEELPAAEDKEWAIRVLDTGWVLAFDPTLDVSADHRFAAGVLEYFRRRLRDYRAVASFVDLPPYRMRDLVTEWWAVLPDGHRSRMRIRLSPWHLSDCVARYAAWGGPSRGRG